jgi:hypothetical protein
LERLLEADSAGLPIQDRAPSSKLIRGVALIVAGNLNHYYPGIYAEHAQIQWKEGRSLIYELGELGQEYLPFMTYNPFSKIKVNPALITNSFYTRKYFQFGSSAGVAYRLI